MSETKKTGRTRILGIVLDVVLVLFLLFSAIILIFALSQKAGKVSQIFGYTLRSVQSDSMRRYDDNGDLLSDAFCKGDLIICEVTDSRTYNVGDVVMFSMPVVLYPDGSHRECRSNEIYDQEITVTHRIVDVVVENGFERYLTQGDANAVADLNLKSANEILAVYTGVRIGGVGAVMDFLQTKGGFFLCIMLPMMLFVVFQAWRVVRNLIIYNKEKALVEATEAVASGELTEEQKRIIAEEYLNKLSQRTHSEQRKESEKTE